MKTETLEKLHRILEALFILFSSIMIMLTSFVSLPVHAAEKVIMSSNVGNHTLVVSHYYNDLFQQSTYSIPFEDNKYFYAVSFTGKKNINGFDQLALYAYLIGSSGSPIKYNFSDSRISILNHNEQKDGSFIDSEGGLCSTLEMWFVPEDYSSSSERGYSYVTSLPFFESVNAMKNYCLTGDTSGLLNGGSIDNPDFEDTAYSFTGFTANNKMTATWTGTTERSYLKDQDVEEYVRVNYYFADKEAQDTIKQADAYPDEFATADKTLTIDVSGLKPDDENWILRYIRITPCYRQAGLGAWGDFYHGVACKVYFNQDGSIDKIVRDFPQTSTDYSFKHVFSTDKYSKEIPAPELSAVSHNGFTLLNNSDNQYYVDIIMESSFYGVKMEKNAGTWLPVVDTDWVYNNHYYNFADTSQVAINNDVIFIPNLYSVNPENDLVTDFKNWSAEYSSYSDLPTMSFLKRSTAARVKYVDQFLYKDDSKYSDSEQIRFSHQAETIFYVRYYNKSMVYGPWVRYKFRDGDFYETPGGMQGGASIDVGQVDVDEDGNVRVDENGTPIVSDNVHGNQNYNTGESNFNDGSFSLSLSDVNSFFDYIQEIFKNVTGSLSSFGSLVAACFGFLPNKLTNAIVFGIVLMMFIGIIKAVKG